MNFHENEWLSIDMHEFHIKDDDCTQHKQNNNLVSLAKVMNIRGEGRWRMDVIYPKKKKMKNGC